MRLHRIILRLLFIFCVGSIATWSAAQEGRQIGVARNQSAAAAIPDAEDNWGIFVGINGFADSTVPLLRFCRPDAEALHNALSGSGKLIPTPQSHLLVTGGILEPSKANILKAIQHACRTAREDSLIFISISTHGFTGPDGEAYVFPADGDKSLLRDTAVSVKRINEMLSKSKASKKILIIDACREPYSSSGRSSGENKMSDAFQDALKESRGQITLASCDLGQISYEDAAVGHGVFTKNLLEGLQGAAPANSQGFITVTTLSQYAVRKTEEWCNANLKPRQTPWLYGSFSRDIPLARGGERQVTSVQQPGSATSRPTPTSRPQATPANQDFSSLDSLLQSRQQLKSDPMLQKAQEYFTQLEQVEAEQAGTKEEMERRKKAWEMYTEYFSSTGYELAHAEERVKFYEQAIASAGQQEATAHPSALLKYKTAFEVNLDKNLNLAPIAVQAQQAYSVLEGKEYIVIQNVGPDAVDVLVRQNGKCIVLVKDYIRQGVTDVAKSYSAFKLIVDKVMRPVRSDLNEHTAFNGWFGDLQVYTSQGNVYHRIVVRPYGERESILVVPNIKVYQAALSYHKDMDGWQAHFQIGSRHAPVKSATGSVDITDQVRFGEQKISNGGRGMQQSYIILEFITDPLEGQFLLTDSGRNPLGEVMTPCKAITELDLPFPNR